MSKPLMAIAAACALVACAAAAQPSESRALVATAQTAQPATGVSCQVHATPTRNGVRLDATVRASHAMGGEYELNIAKNGAEGDAETTQGGPFALNGGVQALSGAEVSLERHAHLHATLTLRDEDGELCSDEVRL